MDEASVYQRLTLIFRDVFLCDDIVLRPGMTAKDIEGWDSFRHIEIVIAAETAFQMKFTTRELDAMQSVGDFVRTIVGRRRP